MTRLTSALSFDGVDETSTAKTFIIHEMSGIKLSVATMSSQKKKLYLKPSTTMELTSSSSMKRNKDTIKNELK